MIKIKSRYVNIVYINNDPTIYVSFSTECNAEKIDEEIENVDVFNSNVDAFSYYGYKFSIVISKND